MKKILFIAFLFFSGLQLWSQKISNIDFDTLKRRLDDDPALYNTLLNRFKQDDTSLSRGDYATLYYGQSFQKDYNPYGRDYANFDKFKTHYDKQEFDQALPFALKVLDNNPLDIQMIFKTLVCHHYLKDEGNKSKMTARYENLLLTIIESGDGKSEETAFVVMRVSDEYELMNNMQVQNTSQSLKSGSQGPCDMMTLKPNDLGLEKLYFNVSKLFESMMKKQ